MASPPKHRVLYALIARQETVLAEFQAPEVHFQVSQIVRLVLQKLGHNEDKSMIYADNYYFHCIARDDISYVCLTDFDFSIRKARAFLEDICTRFVAAYGQRIYTAHTFAFNPEFAPVLEERIEYFNTDPEANRTDKLGQTQKKIDDTIDQMQENIDSMLERGEKIDLLVEKTEQLDQSAFKFERSAKELKHSMWCKKIKTYMCLLCVLIVVLIFILAMICGGLSFNKCPWDKK